MAANPELGSMFDEALKSTGLDAFMPQSPAPTPAPEEPETTFPPVDVVEVEMPSEDEEELAGKLYTKIYQVESVDRKDVEDKWDIAENQYDGLLEREDMPEPWQPNMDINLTFERSKAVAARIGNPMCQQNPFFTGEPIEPQFEAMAKQIEEFLDSKMQDLKKPTLRELVFDSIRDKHIYSICVIKVPWERKTRTVKEWVLSQILTDPLGAMPEQPAPADETQLQSLFQQGYQAKSVGALVDVEYVEREGCFPELVSPRDFGWYPYNAPVLEEADVVWQRIRMSERAIQDEIDSGFFRDELESCHKVNIKETVNDNQLDEVGLGDSSGTCYDIREIYYRDRRKDGKGKVTNFERIMWMDFESKTILRHVENFYSTDRIPFKVSVWEGRTGAILGMSFCYRLWAYHRAISSAINIILDLWSNATGNLNLTNDEELYEKVDGKRVKPGQWQLTRDMPRDAVMQLPMGQSFTPLPEFFSFIERHADIACDLSQSALGIETVDRPTATGTVRQLDEAQMPLFGKLEAHRELFSEVAYAVLNRNKQFFPGGADYQTVGPDGKKSPGNLKLPSGLVENQVVVKVKASTNELNESGRKQESVALLDRLGAYIGSQMQLIMAGSAPSPAQMAIGSLIEANRTMFNRLLEAFKVPDANEINPPLGQEMASGQALMAQIQQLGQQCQALQAQLQQAQGIQPTQPAQGGPGGGGQGGPSGPPSAGGPPSGGGGGHPSPGGGPGGGPAGPSPAGGPNLMQLAGGGAAPPHGGMGSGPAPLA